MGNSDSKKDEKRKYMSFKQPRTSVSQTNILITKQHAITDDYDLLSKNPRVLGTGINGKVILCQNKNTKKKYALKVNHFFFFFFSIQIIKLIKNI
jgi:hypothetical protein